MAQTLVKMAGAEDFLGDPQDVEKILQDMKALGDKNQSLIPKEEHSIEKSKDFSVKPFDDYWRINGVNYRGKMISVDLYKGLLDNGNKRTPDQWFQFTNIERRCGRFYVGDILLMNSLISGLYYNRDSDQDHIEGIRQFLEEQIWNNHRLTTLTRIIYSPYKPDKIVHNYGLSDKFENHANVIGPWEYVKDSKSPELYKALLGNDNLQDINNVYRWLIKKEPFLVRFEIRMGNKDDICMARLSKEGFDLRWKDNEEFLALGVRVLEDNK